MGRAVHLLNSASARCEELVSNPISFFFTILTLVTGCLAWTFTYWRDLLLLVSRWGGEDYSHCYLVPLISAYLAWSKRKFIQANMGGSPLLGYTALLLATGLYFVSRAASLQVFVFFSMWCSLFAIFLISFGHLSFKALWQPIGICLFAIPLPPFINNVLNVKFKLLSSALAEGMLNLANVPVYREGNYIDLGSTQLHVVDACSGLRYLWPALLMSVIMGWIFLRKPVHRFILIVISPLITVLSNAIRITLTGILAKYITPALAEGFFHDFSGWLVYVASLGLTAFIAIKLNKNKLQINSRVNKEFVCCINRPHWAHGIAVFLFCIVLTGVQALPITVVKHQRVRFVEFPANIGYWSGLTHKLSKRELKSLGADDYYLATYTNPQSKNVIHTLVTWYDCQTTQKAVHAPTSCLLGGGWTLKEKTALSPNVSRPFAVGQMLLTRNNISIISNYYFLQRGRVLTSEWLNKFYLLIDSITKQRTDGALVRVEMALQPGQTIKEGQAILDKYAAQLRTVLTPFLPNDYSLKL